MLVKLLEILEDQPNIDKKLLKLMIKVMDCSHITLFLSGGGVIKPILSCGTAESPERIIKLIEYCCYTHEKFINIRDLSVEPLINTEYSSELNSCLIIPITTQSDSKAVFCFMRETKEFSLFDKKLSDEISKKLSKYNTFLNTLKIRINLVRNSEVNMLKKFSIPEDSDFDFYHLFYNIKVKLGNLFRLSSCSIYISDQIKEQL